MKFDLFNTAAKAQEQAKRQQELQLVRQAHRERDLAGLVRSDDAQGLADFLREHPDATGWRCSIDDGSDITQQTALHMAASRGSVGIAKQLIAAKAVVDAPESEIGGTPLMWAAHHCHAPMVELLVAEGADVNKAASNSRTPLTFAVGSGDLDSARILIYAGAEMNALEKSGETPLFWATRILNPATAREMCSLLLRHGTDATLRNNAGKTASEEILSFKPELAAFIDAYAAEIAAKRAEEAGRAAEQEVKEGIAAPILVGKPLTFR